MAGKGEKVVVAMSGGVDSSVAACLLVEQGFDVVGLFMRVGSPGAKHASQAAPTDGRATSAAPHAAFRRLAAADRDTPDVAAPAAAVRSHQGCCSAADAADARYVAGMLGIPFYALNFEDDFESIIDYFADEYARGRTPNPCVVCNDRLKFGKLLTYGDAIGAKYIATGHYARITREPNGNAASTGGPFLLRGIDSRKDQSYVLFGIKREVLARTLFPIGHLTKDEVRAIAAHYDLPNQNKPDSVEICFVPDRDYARLVRNRRPDGFIPGDVTDQHGNTIGRHEGLGNYTVGQRRGLGIAAGKPIYVTRLDVLNNRVVMGHAQALESPGLIADRANFLVAGLGESFRATAKIRYLHAAVPATVHLLGLGRVRVVFDVPQRAVTPGQAVVFYQRDIVLGGAWIAEPLAESTP